ncbi:vestitone reductase-like [Arachis stenosperma]|uniref:vestitone reductase-like n=1 Tax=Arachis stenosperma TaxID=217475 RepID=UPI0025AC54C3|nr:vestitone reductase-like [Arachis stenosperma]
MEEGKGRVCVTGGTGFLGSWIIKRLLQDGYSVNTTIRSDPKRKRDISFLTNLPGASQKLKIFNADLSNPESFTEAIEGCFGVFHTATPIDLLVTEPEKLVTKRTIDGALGILKACLDSKTVRRVVYTSSGAAVSRIGREEGELEAVDESSWSNVEYLRNLKPYGWSYGVAKTLTEKAVLQFGEETGLEVVTLIPPFVVGSFICPKLPDSVERALLLVLGKKDEIGVTRMHMAHVDDVARAHIFLLEHPNPKGRYNCSPFIVSIQQISQLLSAKYPQFQIPTLDEVREIKGVKQPELISKKLTDAGFVFKYSLEEMFEDAIECCKEKGFL